MIQFGTGGWRAVIGDDFIKVNIQKIGAALARRILREQVQDEGVCVGYDRRFLSRESAIWFSEALAGEGVHVLFVNLCAPTPQIMFTVRQRGLHYGATVTASHNPAIYNGIKLFTFGGRDADISFTDAIGKEANAIDPDSIRTVDFEKALHRGLIEYIDPRDDYLDSILRQVDIAAIRKRRPRIVLDPMYGVSLAGLQTILYTARCDINVINDRHDAFFGGHLPAPDPDTLVDLQHEVLEHHADLGIATDGDADRLGVIDEKGRYISANEILVLLYFYLLKYKKLHGCAIRNLATTHLLDRVAEKFGEECYEVPVGFKYISAGMEEHHALIGGESSGGLTVAGHILGKDGLYAASLLVEMISVTGKPLSTLIQDLYAQFGEVHMVQYDWALTTELKAEIYEKVMEKHDLPDFGLPVVRINWTDGCKIYFREGWIIIRFSGTEPRVRIFAEFPTEKEANSAASLLAAFVGLPTDNITD